MSARRRNAACLFAVVVALVVWGSGRQPARAQQEGQNPILAQVKATLKDPSKPFTMAVRLSVQPGMEEKFEAAFATAVKPTRQEKGCLAYELSRDAKTPTQYLAYERWRDLEGLDAHLNAPHFKTLVAAIGDLLSGAPEVQVLVPVGE